MRSKLISFLVLASVVSFPACSLEPSSRDQGEKVQEEIMQRAVKAVPVPQVNNFSTRKVVAKWMKRMDTPEKLWYIYIISDAGSFIAYHVGKNRPVNICTLMTPPDREVSTRGSGANPLGAAPALDGVFYLSGGCNSNYFFDAETDALVELQSSMKYLTYDQPLAVEAPRLKFEKVDDEE